MYEVLSRLIYLKISKCERYERKAKKKVMETHKEEPLGICVLLSETLRNLEKCPYFSSYGLSPSSCISSFSREWQRKELEVIYYKVY